MSSALLTRPGTPAATIRRQTQSAIDAVTKRLVAAYADSVGGGVVLAEVLRSRDLLISQGVRAGLVPATEAAAKIRLGRREKTPAVQGQLVPHASHLRR